MVSSITRGNESKEGWKESLREVKPLFQNNSPSLMLKERDKGGGLHYKKPKGGKV